MKENKKMEEFAEEIENEEVWENEELEENEEDWEGEELDDVDWEDEKYEFEIYDEPANRKNLINFLVSEYGQDEEVLNEGYTSDLLNLLEELQDVDLENESYEEYCESMDFD